MSKVDRLSVAANADRWEKIKLGASFLTDRLVTCETKELIRKLESYRRQLDSNVLSLIQ